MVTETSTESAVVLRDSATIGADIGAAATSGDIKRLRELASELDAAVKRERTKELDAINAKKSAVLDPIKQAIVAHLEGDTATMDFLREAGGTFSFMYRMAPEGSENGPLVTINASAVTVKEPTAKAASNGGTASTPSANRAGKLTDQYGIPLSALWDLVATDEEKLELDRRVSEANNKNSASWAIKNRVVQKAIEAGDPRLPAKVA